MFFIIHPERLHRRPHWPLYSKWYHNMDLPPAPYWTLTEFKGWNRRDLPVLPGEVIELVVVLTEDSPRQYHGLPLCTIRDEVHVLRRVRLMKTYKYEEIFQSSLYSQWRSKKLLEAYNVRPLPPIGGRRNTSTIKKECV